LHRASTKKPVDEARDPARQGTAGGPEGLRHRYFSRFCRWYFRYFFWLLPRYRFGFRNGFFMSIQLVSLVSGCPTVNFIIHNPNPWTPASAPQPGLLLPKGEVLTKQVKTSGS
jgi:hypothetical protein